MIVFFVRRKNSENFSLKLNFFTDPQASNKLHIPCIKLILISPKCKCNTIWISLLPLDQVLLWRQTVKWEQSRNITDKCPKIKWSICRQAPADILFQIGNNKFIKKLINLSYRFVGKGGFPFIELKTIHKRWSIR